MFHVHILDGSVWSGKEFSEWDSAAVTSPIPLSKDLDCTCVNFLAEPFLSTIYIIIDLKLSKCSREMTWSIKGIVFCH